MPSRHSSNAGDRHHFTYAEKQATGYGSQKVRLGTDSQLPFGKCGLCLKRCVEPTATPSGRLYCRECIVEHLLTKTRELKYKREAFDAKERKKEAAAAEALSESSFRELVTFVDQQGPNSNNSNEEGMAQGISDEKNKNKLGEGHFCTLKRRAAGEALDISEEFGSASAHKFYKKTDDRSREEKLADLKKTSFWLPCFQPEKPETELLPPPRRPSSPMSGNPLRAKDLIPVTLDWDNDTALCAVSKKQLRSQELVLLSVSGRIILKSVYDEFALPTMTCPVTGEKFKKKHVVHMQRSGTGFAGSGAAVEAKVYQSSMN